MENYKMFLSALPNCADFSSGEIATIEPRFQLQEDLKRFETPTFSSIIIILHLGELSPRIENFVPSTLIQQQYLCQWFTSSTRITLNSLFLDQQSCRTDHNSIFNLTDYLQELPIIEIESQVTGT